MLPACPVNLSDRSAVVARQHPVVEMSLRINIFRRRDDSQSTAATDGIASRERRSSSRCSRRNPHPCIGNAAGTVILNGMPAVTTRLYCQSDGYDSWLINVGLALSAAIVQTAKDRRHGTPNAEKQRVQQHCAVFLNYLTVQFSYRIYVSCSLITEIMAAALTRSNCEETFQFSAGQRTVRVSVLSS